MNDLNEYLNGVYNKFYDSFINHLNLANEFAKKVNESEGLSEDTKKELITLGISMIASHFIGD